MATLKQKMAIETKEDIYLGNLRKYRVSSNLHSQQMDYMIKNSTEQELIWLLNEIDKTIGLLVSHISPSKTTKPHVTKERTNTKVISVSLRYDILKRDGFKCNLCGRNPEDDGVKLHVDHIKPFSKGGLTVKSNLQSL